MGSRGAIITPVSPAMVVAGAIWEIPLKCAEAEANGQD